MSISKSNALQSTNSPHVKWEQTAGSRQRGLGLGLGLGIFAFAIITINTICRAIPILLAKHGSMGQSDEQKFNALWKTATTTTIATKTTTEATLEDSQNEIQLICSSNWQTVIICHVYGHWHKVESKFCYPSHIAFYTYHLNCPWMAVILFFSFLSFNFCYPFLLPFLLISPAQLQGLRAYLYL